MNTKTIVTLLAIVLITAAAYWFGNQRGEQTAQTSKDGKVTIHRANTANAPGAPDSTNQAKKKPTKPKQSLPDIPNDEALVNRFDSLKQRAESGNRKATCELARDLSACKDFRAEEVSMEMMTESLVSSDEDVTEISDDMVDFMAGEQERLARLKRMCRDLPESMKKQAFAIQTLGANQGIEHIQVQFLTNPALSQHTFLDDLDRWQAYKRMAPLIADKLLRQGNADAVGWLAGLHSTHNTASGIGFSVPDRIKGLTYTILSNRLLAIQYGDDDEQTGEVDEYTQKMGAYTEQEIEQASNRADVLQKQHFSQWAAKHKQEQDEDFEFSTPDVDCNQL